MRVLLADDEPSLLMLLKRLCEERGCAVVAVSSGAALARAAGEASADLVISDVRMDGEDDGLRACVALRRARPGTTIVLMTGDPGLLPRLRREGFHHVLVKPFSLAAVRRLLP